jgi:hypothetical protein
MAVEIGTVSLDQLTHVEVRERADIVRHRVPGLDGDLSQALGRPSVEVAISGIFFGDTAADDLGKLRKIYLDRKPVDFLADAVGDGYFTQVLIANLSVAQRAGETDQFDFTCEVVEYVEPPQPAVSSPFGDIDTSLIDEASGFMDDVQNAVDQVSKLADLAANVPSFGDPTTKLTKMPADYIGLVTGGGLQTLTGLKDLF